MDFAPRTQHRRVCVPEGVTRVHLHGRAPRQGGPHFDGLPGRRSGARGHERNQGLRLPALAPATHRKTPAGTPRHPHGPIHEPHQQRGTKRTNQFKYNSCLILYGPEKLSWLTTKKLLNLLNI
jgi:hypothetical protein